MNIIDAILLVDKTSDKDSIFRCIVKANIIVYTDGIYLIADDEYIYYFGAIASSRGTKKLGKFIKNNKHYANGKFLYSEDITPFKRYTTVIDEDSKLYKWGK